MDYRVSPGLYAVGRPDPESAVFVTANYKLSFDVMRRALGALPGGAWVLVLETQGICVWCAAGAGTLSTEELAGRVAAARLAEVVRHRLLILPQLAAPGVCAEQVERLTGFRVAWGPVRASDIAAFAAAGRRASPRMRSVSFPLRERVLLVPFELGRALKASTAFIMIAFILCGVTPHGVSFASAWAGVWPLLLLGLFSILAGSVGVPLLPPSLPPRAFLLKGWILGAAAAALFLHGAGLAAGMDPMETAACWVFFPSASAALALAYTGATPFTSRSGVEAELHAAIPALICAAVLTLAAVLLWKLGQWGVLALF
jgi:hypothetical protein